MNDYRQPLCMFCRNLIDESEVKRCRAFPEGIPEEILTTEADHRKPFEGDGGIRFESMSDEAEKRATEVFGKRKKSILWLVKR